MWTGYQGENIPDPIRNQRYKLVFGKEMYFRNWKCLSIKRHEWFFLLKFIYTDIMACFYLIIFTMQVILCERDELNETIQYHHQMILKVSKSVSGKEKVALCHFYWVIKRIKRQESSDLLTDGVRFRRRPRREILIFHSWVLVTDGQLILHCSWWSSSSDGKKIN